MKKIAIVSEESLFSGNIKCGIAEVVDSLALSLTGNYEVNIICKEGTSVPSKRIVDFENIRKGVSFARFMQINYYIIQAFYWEYERVKIISELKPDILHNFCDPTIVSYLNCRPKVTVFTFDDLNFLNKYLDYLKDYDYITTFSCGYRDYVLQQKDKVADALKEISFAPVSVGIASEIFTPSTGLFLKMPYTADTISQKEINKKAFLESINCQIDGPIFLTMGNISYRKGADFLLQAAPVIKSIGGYLVIFGEAEKKYENKLKELFEKEIIYFHSKVFPTNVLPILAGTDFYLQPSLMESGGLLPMAASQYGVIPIVTQNGGFKDNFNKNNAIIIEGNIIDSIFQAKQLYEAKNDLVQKRKICMNQDFGWNIRKNSFIKLYESKQETK